MKKLLFQFDTDAHPSVFDCVVAYDGGADRVIGHGLVTPDNVAPLVDGAIFTRPPKDKRNTAIFVGGSDMQAGQALFEAVRQRFFGDFRVSVMLDSNASGVSRSVAVLPWPSSTECRVRPPLRGKVSLLMTSNRMTLPSTLLSLRT